MAGRAKYFELLDFPKFAYPSVVGMDAVQTSFNLIERLGGGGFIDVSERDKGKGRILSPHAIPPDEAISFQEFDDAVRLFVKALALAGVALPTNDSDSVVDLFKTK
jgi:hypothetical protein